jgi:hypothetical protein
MTMHVVAKDLDDLWDAVNYRFITDPSVIDFTRPGVSIHSYHNTFEADNCECKLSLTDLGYKKTKWSMLLRLYFDPEEYRMMIARLRHYKEVERRGKVYVPDIGMQFKTRENRTGACLMGFTLRFAIKTGWQCSVFSRTNETTARWSVDLIFINRLLTAIGNELGYFTPSEVKLFWTTGSVFQSVVTAPLYMTIAGREKEVIRLAKRFRQGDKTLTAWEAAVARRYGQSYNAKYSETGALKYQSYKSQVRVTQAYFHHTGRKEPDKELPNTSLHIPQVNLEIAGNFFSKKGFR